MTIGTTVHHQGSVWTVANLFEMNGRNYARLWNGRFAVNVRLP